MRIWCGRRLNGYGCSANETSNHRQKDGCDPYAAFVPPSLSIPKAPYDEADAERCEPQELKCYWEANLGGNRDRKPPTGKACQYDRTSGFTVPKKSRGSDYDQN